jgi:hypothetical protein
VLEHAARDEEIRAMATTSAPSSGCGRSVRCPTTARSRRPRTPSLRDPLWIPDAGG